MKAYLRIDVHKLPTSKFWYVVGYPPHFWGRDEFKFKTKAEAVKLGKFIKTIPYRKGQDATDRFGAIFRWARRTAK